MAVARPARMVAAPGIKAILAALLPDAFWPGRPPWRGGPPGFECPLLAGRPDRSHVPVHPARAAPSAGGPGWPASGCRCGSARRS
ncbi:hypothetical protein WDV06_21800 [Streptomyces racemochromogenes]|uniref:Uncharacterized protein n=1 Tax=Streptomyces racemochromogenes TaxID=67353 RepID=A0ABW7PID4_9ACTN